MRMTWGELSQAMITLGCGWKSTNESDFIYTPPFGDGMTNEDGSPVFSYILGSTHFTCVETEVSYPPVKLDNFRK